MSGYGDPCTTASVATLYVKRGDTWVFTAQWRDSEGAPIDLTGATVRQFVYAKGDPVAVLELATDTSGLTLKENPDQPAGVLCDVETNVPYADMEAVPVGSYTFDQEVTFFDGRRMSTDTMTLTVLQDVTQ